MTAHTGELQAAVIGRSFFIGSPMLRQRVVTALILLALLLPALFYTDPTPFLFLILVFLAAGAWEWGRLNQLSQSNSLLTAMICQTLCGVTRGVGGVSKEVGFLWVSGGIAWVIAGSVVLSRGVAGWGRIPSALRWLVGVVFLWLAWLAVAQARFVGHNFLLSVLALVWVADVGAYFFGRALGGRFVKGKLAPSISPGKSWEGVWGGMLCVFLFGVGWVWVDQTFVLDSPSLFSQLYRAGIPWFVGGTILLAAMSVVGDLVESLVKRNAQVKDSSALLPGHGGVLDRIDAILPTLPLALMLSVLTNS